MLPILVYYCPPFLLFCLRGVLGAMRFHMNRHSCWSRVVLSARVIDLANR